MRWERRGEVLPGSARYRARNNPKGSTLHIRDIRLSDQGEWMCIGNNSIGGDSISFNIFVQIPPQILKPDRKSYVTVAGGELAIDCVASGNPQPKIMWMKSESQEIVTKSNRLFFDGAADEDTGAYLCVAKNDAGEAFREIAVKVQIPPHIKKQPNKREVVVGDSVVLNCNIEVGDPEPVFGFKKKTIPENFLKYSIV